MSGIKAAPDAGKKVNEIAIGLKGSKHKLYIIIDEYDNFTNTILAESGLNAYNDLCHGDGFFKDFFARLKAATSGTETAVPRLFITGVSLTIENCKYGRYVFSVPNRFASTIIEEIGHDWER